MCAWGEWTHFYQIRILFTFGQKYSSRDIHAGQNWSIRLQSGHDWNLNDIFLIWPRCGWSFRYRSWSQDQNLWKFGSSDNIFIFLSEPSQNPMGN
jgi:hypothetical protein